MIKKSLSIFILLPVFLQVISCKNADLSSDKGKYSYAIGMQIGSNIKRQGLDIDVNSLGAGIQDTISGTKSRVSDEDIRKAMAALTQKMEGERKDISVKSKKEGEEYLMKNKTKNGVVITKSGLQYEILKAGAGISPRADDTVKVHYSGTLINGTEFDSSHKRNQPAEFQVNRVIPGWTEALQLMNRGAKFKLTIPSELAYGEEGTPGIPGNSVLIFEVELLDILKK